uniref:TauD/TfdA-like domain-containing protein n=1 Tax=Hanusia phi TaxID=3032 RepID=A0A7S0H8C6_9CRYP|mmetsp:Transcript_14836/g.34102  ORF Transcript_14836/g.34102 Transcript_14836/m.34102 type:complete len:435 (+) Transcript_14836:168-1472(+)
MVRTSVFGWNGSKVAAVGAVVAMSMGECVAFLPASPMLLRSSAPARASSGRIAGLRMQVAQVKDRAQDVGEGQAEQRAAAERLMQPCPVTKWGPTDLDVLELQKQVQQMDLPSFPFELAKPGDLGDLDAQERYFAENKESILANLEKHGAVVLKGFDLTKEPKGFERMWKALGMEACLDPLHSVAGRPVVSGDSAVYEAVNKPSRAKFYVGMHNEMVGKRTVRRAAFVCFKAAEVGGEFIITDGMRMLRDLDPKVLKSLYEKKIRFSSAELPMGFLDKTGPLQPVLEPILKTVIGAIVDMKVDFEVDMFWNRVNGERVIQAHAPPQPPVILHPDTSLPTWFCNIHSHSATLRDERDGVLPETTGASRLNKSDVFYGDGSQISKEDLKHIDEITKKNQVYVAMKQGDVVLIDNYRAMHGRNVFEGTRKHAVTWFK